MTSSGPNLFELRKDFRFEAAHRLPHVPPGHKCARLHGHSFRLTVVVRGPLAPSLDWVVDYADMSAAVKPLLEKLDHYYLNDIPGLENPTSEVLARYCYEALAPKLPGLAQIIIGETCTTECRYPVKSSD